MRRTLAPTAAAGGLAVGRPTDTRHRTERPLSSAPMLSPNGQCWQRGGTHAERRCGASLQEAAFHPFCLTMKLRSYSIALISIFAAVALGVVAYPRADGEPPSGLQVVKGVEDPPGLATGPVNSPTATANYERRGAQVSAEATHTMVRGKVTCATTNRPLAACIRSGPRVVWSSPDRGGFSIMATDEEISIILDGYEPNYVRLPTGRDEVLIHMKPLDTVHIKVVDGRGSELPNAEIEVATPLPSTGKEIWQVVAMTDAEGEAAIPCRGVNAIRARAGEVYSEPRVAGPGNVVIVCDALQSCLLELRDESGGPVSGVIELTALSGASGTITSVRTDQQGVSQHRVPFGVYAAQVWGHGPIKGLSEAGVTIGQILNVVSTDPLVLCVPSQKAHLQVLSAATSSVIAAAHVRLEINEKERWLPWGQARVNDEGLLRCSDLARMLARIRTSAVRGIVEAPGYSPVELTGSSLCAPQIVYLWPISARSVEVCLRQGADAFRGAAFISCVDGEMVELGPKVQYDGARAASATILVPTRTVYIGVSASDGSSAEVVTMSRLDPGDSRINVQLPGSCAVSVVDVPESAGALAIRRPDGAIINGTYQQGVVSFRDLLPGAYVVGPRDAILRHDAPPQFTWPVSLVEGQDLEVTWLDAWMPSRSMSGIISLAGGGMAHDLFVVPSYAERISMGRSVLSHAVRVDDRGRFCLPALSPAPANLAVFSILPNGEPLLLGVDKPHDEWRLDACEVELDLSGVGKENGVVVMIVDHGGWKSQYIVPWQSGHILKMGGLPRSGVSMRVVAAGSGSINVPVPMQSGLVAVER